MNILAHGERFARLFSDNLVEAMRSQVIPSVKNFIIDSYDDKLLGVVPEGSLGRPEDFRELFIERLNEYNFVRKNVISASFSVPDAEKFDFSGDLSFLKYVFEGMAGVYYLIPMNTYRLLGYTPPDLRQTLYLVREDDPLMNDVRKFLGDTFLEPYAFSNSPPIDIFEGADKYARDKIKKALESAVGATKDAFGRKY